MSSLGWKFVETHSILSMVRGLEAGGYRVFTRAPPRGPGLGGQTPKFSEPSTAFAVWRSTIRFASLRFRRCFVRIRTALLGGVLCAMALWAADSPDRDDLLGSWEVQGGNAHETWSIQSDTKEMTVTRKQDGKVTFNVTCPPFGSECKGEDEGKNVKVSMYFNGAALVQIETRGSDVFKRRFSLEGADKELSIEVTPITGGKSVTMHLKKDLQASAAK